MAPSVPAEKTFRAYNTSDAQKYAQHRLPYSDALYQSIYAYHSSTGGKLGTVVDLGCGPGIATFKLAQTFKIAIGLDPSEAMISTARALASEKQASGGPVVRFEVSTAEHVSAELIPDGSVDLITAATCAHWFDLNILYQTAARILAPNGTIALFTSRSSVHPATPNAATMNTTLRALQNAELLPYYEPGNRLARDLYVDLPLPWTVSPPADGAFPKSLFVRKTFGLDADEAEGQVEGEELHVGPADQWLDLDTVEKMLATESPVARWREANLEKVGTEKDVVKKLRRALEKGLWDAGVEKGKERVRPGGQGVLLMLTKQA